MIKATEKTPLSLTSSQQKALERLLNLGIGMVYDYDSGMVGFYNERNVSDVDKFSHGHEIPEGFLDVDENGITWESVGFMYFSTEYALCFKPKEDIAD